MRRGILLILAVLPLVTLAEPASGRGVRRPREPEGRWELHELQKSDPVRAGSHRPLPLETELPASLTLSLLRGMTTITFIQQASSAGGTRPFFRLNTSLWERLMFSERDLLFVSGPDPILILTRPAEPSDGLNPLQLAIGPHRLAR